MTVYLKELDEGQGELTLDRALAKMRDEVRAVMLDRHRGNSYELAHVVAKLSEARLWAIQYGEATGSLTVVDRASLLKTAATMEAA